MPDIHFTRPHQLGTDALRRTLETLASQLQTRFGIASQWRQDTLELRGAGLNGAIAVAPDQVTVDAHLGLLLAPMKATLEAEIARKLDECLTPTRAADPSTGAHNVSQ